MRLRAVTSIGFMLWLLLSGRGHAQDTPGRPDPTKLALDNAEVKPAAVRQPYHFQFNLRGGTPPMKWEIIRGELPPNTHLDDNGLLSGTPSATGEWRFTVGVTDSSKPPQSVSREVVLRVAPPLELAWKDYPKVGGHRIDGRIEVSNSTEDDFDFTVIILAVDEIGKAFAIGYQRFPLKRGTELMEIPFGDNVPQGSYMVHADVVGEVPSKNAIYHARLQTKTPLPVTAGP